MGLFYEHVTVCGPTQAILADYMKETKRNGYVSPTIDDVTVVYDQASSVDIALIFGLARDLSARFDCPALAVHIHDSDVMYYQLFRDGNLLDAYDSLPDYFDDSVESSSPSGGDATLLCSAFGKPGAVKQVVTILHHVDNNPEQSEFWLAEERHAKLSQALGWPSFIPNIGYDYIAANGFDEEFDGSAFVRIRS